MGDINVSDALDTDTWLSKLWDGIKDELSASFRRGAGNALLIIAVVLLCSASGAMYSGETPDFVPLAGTIAVAAVAVGDMRAFIGLGNSILNTLSDFSKVLLPSLTAAATAAGAISSATAKYAAVSLFMDILLTAAQNFIMPLIYAYIALVIANAAMGNNVLSGAASLVKWLCVSAMTALVIAFAAYLSITGAISGPADAVATRVAKTTLSTALPVVGSIISDAAGAVVAGAGMLRNAVGVFGMLCVMCVCLAPFIKLGAHYLIYKAAAGVSGAFADGRLTGLVSGLSSAFGMVLSIVGAGALMMFISLISFIKAVSGI